MHIRESSSVHTLGDESRIIKERVWRVGTGHESGMSEKDTAVSINSAIVPSFPFPLSVTGPCGPRSGSKPRCNKYLSIDCVQKVC